MTTYQRSAINTASDVEAVADHAGSFFFAPATMRAFSSRLLGGVEAIDGRETLPGRRYLFVTSERYGDEPRHYAVRIMTLGTQRDDRPAVDITTYGDEHYATADAARRAMARIAADLRGESGA